MSNPQLIAAYEAVLDEYQKLDSANRRITMEEDEQILAIEEEWAAAEAAGVAPAEVAAFRAAANAHDKVVWALRDARTEELNEARFLAAMAWEASL